MKGLLAGYGVRLALQGDVAAEIEQARQWDGSPLPAAVRARLKREWQKVQWLTEQIVSLEAERREILHPSAAPVVEQVRHLATLRRIGVDSAWLLVMECFAWLGIQTPKQVGAIAGPMPAPYQRVEAFRELGITKAGHGDMRTMAVEMAWGWVRFQPASTLTQWYQARFGRESARLRNIGIVALARKLLIALWRWCVHLVAGHEFWERTDAEEGLPNPGLQRRLECMADRVFGIEMPTRIEGRGGR
jgi:transposase